MTIKVLTIVIDPVTMITKDGFIATIYNIEPGQADSFVGRVQTNSSTVSVNWDTGGFCRSNPDYNIDNRAPMFQELLEVFESLSNR
jgi:hypothetical protein